MGLKERVANTIHAQQGWYLADTFQDAPIASWGTLNGRLFSPIGTLADKTTTLTQLPKPQIVTKEHESLWFNDGGVTATEWTASAQAPIGVPIAISSTVTFSTQWSIACFLTGYYEDSLANTDKIGETLARINDEDDKTDPFTAGRWPLRQSWVYSAARVKQGIIIMNNQPNISRQRHYPCLRSAR